MGDRLRVGIPSRAVTSQLGQLSLASLRGRLIKYQLRLVLDDLNPFYFLSHTLAFHSQLLHVLPLPSVNLCNAPL